MKETSLAFAIISGMNQAQCTVVVERLADGCFRASCPLFPDCEAVARTEEEARRAVERAVEALLAKERDERN
jgi:predicted RNase H-like HicB family nuclease